MTEIKFCGLTRQEDADVAVSLGANYLGAIFASGPRLLTVERAADVFANVPASVRRVGVFAHQDVMDIARVARELGLAVVQMHAGVTATRVASLRQLFDGQIWSACRIEGARLPGNFADLDGLSDALLLDAFVPGTLGGTGVALDWNALSIVLQNAAPAARIVLAGGLKPENVGQAISALSPGVVDVSSGVESAPGIKDHSRMRAFRDAVSQASIST